jgi:hypothetical protein
MLAAKLLLGLGVIGLIVTNAWRKGVGMLGVGLLAFMVAVNLGYFWAMRPQLASFALYALLLALLSWCFHGWEGQCWLRKRDRAGESSDLTYSPARLKWLWLAPVLFLIWANTHGGFVAGFCIFSAYLCLRGFESYWVRGNRAFGLLRRFAMMIAAAGLATLINPYGPLLHGWMLGSLGSPRPEILEWHAPDLTTLLMLPLWILMIGWFTVLLLTERSRDATHVAILGLTLWQSLEHVRHVPFFAIAFGFWMAPHVESVLRRLNVSSTAADVGRLTPATRRTFAVLLMLTLVAVGGQLLYRLSELKVDRGEYPVSAFQYIADRQLQGKMVVTFNWAQYAIAAFGAERPEDDGLRVSFDGRFRTCYPQQVVDMNFDFILEYLTPRHRGADSPPFNDEHVLESGQPDLVLISRRQPHSVNVMFRNRSDWTLLYQDKLAQLWGRKTRYDDPLGSDFIPFANRHISEDKQEGSVPWPALPTDKENKNLIADNR